MEYNITYRQKDKGWQYIISIKKDDKWGYGGSKQGFKTKALAKAAAETKIDEMKEKSKIKLTEDHDKITLKQFKEMFLSDLEVHREGNTLESYDVAFIKFSKLDDMIMENIEFAHIQNTVNEMIKAGLKVSTVKQYLSKIKVLFKSAVKPYKVITESPITDDIVLPIQKNNKDEKVKALAKTELNKILSQVKPEKDYIMCLLASHCGMRIGEIVGLCDTDINFQDLKITINKQWKILKDGSYGFGTVKSQNRDVPLPSSIKLPLENFINNNKVKQFDRRVFSDKNTNATSRRIARKIKGLGFDNSIHDLRHTYVTTLLANGVDFKTIAELVGDNVETVIKTYSHFTEDMANAVAEKVNQIFL